MVSAIGICVRIFETLSKKEMNKIASSKVMYLCMKKSHFFVAFNGFVYSYCMLFEDGV